MTDGKRIRLIALDIDGTLLDDQKHLPPANRDALQEVRARGVQVAIASGRMVPSIEPIQDLLGIDCSLIAYNGAKVLSSRAEGRQCLQYTPLDAGVAGELIRYSREHDALLNFYLHEVLYAEDSPSRRELMELYSRRTGAKYNMTNLDRFLGVSPTKLILLFPPDVCRRRYKEFQKDLDGRATVTISDPEYLEFMAVGVDKGMALPVLAEHYGIGTGEILAMGDADNDRPLLLQAGLGVAVANAREAVKEAATAITKRTNSEGAVAEAVERWVLGKEPW